MLFIVCYCVVRTLETDIVDTVDLCRNDKLATCSKKKKKNLLLTICPYLTVLNSVTVR